LGTADQQPYVNYQHGGQHQQYYNMEGNNRLPKSQLGATFYPGGNDDFYMPEVVSPTPQRYEQKLS
jgi:hypothetical protein